MNACAHCHRPLTDPVSRKRGLGPECWTDILQQVHRAQSEDRLPLGPFAGDVILIRVDGRTYANLPRLVRHPLNTLSRVEWVWGRRGYGAVETALNILSQFLLPYEVRTVGLLPDPQADILAGPFAARFIERAPHAGCIILQRDILKWLRGQILPETSIRTFGVLA
jgi:hypothetical protein